MMAKNIKSKDQRILSRLSEISTMPKRAAAKVLFNEFPDAFSGIEHARVFIRYITGNTGAKDYTTAARSGVIIADTFGKIDFEPIECDTTPLQIPTGIKDMLILNDGHSLFMDRQAAETAIDYGVQMGIDTVYLNGDFMDNYQLSRFDKSANKSRFHKERDMLVEFLKMLQQLFKNVYYKEGNHEVRYKHYLERNAPAIFSEEENTIESVLHFEGSKVIFVPDYKIAAFGKLAIIHGHELPGGGEVNIARNKMLKAYANIAFGHHHKVDQSPMKDIYGDYFMSWSMGCLCQLSPAYRPYNQWMQGFATVERTTSEGDFRFDNKMIIKGKIL